MAVFGNLFLRFLVLGLCAAVLAVLFKLDFALYLLLILASPVVQVLALLAREADELVL